MYVPINLDKDAVRAADKLSKVHYVDIATQLSTCLSPARAAWKKFLVCSHREEETTNNRLRRASAIEWSENRLLETEKEPAITSITWLACAAKILTSVGHPRHGALFFLRRHYQAGMDWSKAIKGLADEATIMVQIQPWREGPALFDDAECPNCGRTDSGVYQCPCGTQIRKHRFDRSGKTIIGECVITVEDVKQQLRLAHLTSELLNLAADVTNELITRAERSQDLFWLEAAVFLSHCMLQITGPFTDARPYDFVHPEARRWLGISARANNTMHLLWLSFAKEDTKQQQELER